MGPSGNGLVGADERRAKNSAKSRAFRKGAPVRFQKAVSRTKEKRRGEAPIGAPARVMGRPFPPAGGTGFAVRRATGCGVPHQRLSALRPLGWGDIPQRRPGARSPGAMKLTPIERQARGTRAAPCPQPGNHETTESILAKRTRGTSALHFGGTNPRSLRSTFPRRTGMIAADQPSGTTRGI